MILDQQQFGFSDGILVFPNWSFPDLPKQSSDILETIGATGSSTGTTISITGTTDDLE